MQPTSTATHTSAPDPVLPASTPIDTAHHTAQCQHCGTLLVDKFCGHCGQPADTHRITMRHLLLHDLPHSVWHVDKGIFYTLRQMLTRPGATLREYMAGQRAQHFRPITYLLLITAVSMLLMSFIEYDPLLADKQTEMPRLLKLTMEGYTHFYSKYPTIVYVFLLPINALLAAWLLRPARFNFAEMLLIQAFVAGTTTVLFTILMLPLMLLITRFPFLKLLILVPMLPYVAYSIWAYRQLLEPALLSTANKWVRSISTVALQTAVMVLSGGLVFIGIMFTLARQDPSLMKELTKGKQKASAPTSVPAPRP